MKLTPATYKLGTRKFLKFSPVQKASFNLNSCHNYHITFSVSLFATTALMTHSCTYKVKLLHLFSFPNVSLPPVPWCKSEMRDGTFGFCGDGGRGDSDDGNREDGIKGAETFPVFPFKTVVALVRFL